MCPVCRCECKADRAGPGSPSASQSVQEPPRSGGFLQPYLGRMWCLCHGVTRLEKSRVTRHGDSEEVMVPNVQQGLLHHPFFLILPSPLSQNQSPPTRSECSLLLCDLTPSPFHHPSLTHPQQAPPRVFVLTLLFLTPSGPSCSHRETAYLTETVTISSSHCLPGVLSSTQGIQSWGGAVCLYVGPADRLVCRKHADTVLVPALM